MPTLLSRIGNLAIPAAAARGSYKAGQVEGQRQSMIDKMQQAIQGAQLDETKSRSDYYKAQSGDQWHEGTNGDIYNGRSGEVHRGSEKPPTIHGEEHYEPERNEVGFTITNADGTVGWKKTRDATLTDKMRYERIPHDGSEPPAERPEVTEARKNELARKKAEDLVSDFMASHDLNDLTEQNLQIFAGHRLTHEERAALGRTRTPPAAERSFSIPPISDGKSPTIEAPKAAKAPVTPRKRPGEAPVKSVDFQPVSGFGRAAADPQDEIDKAALRKAHPEMNEVQINTLLGQLRIKKPE